VVANPLTRGCLAAQFAEKETDMAEDYRDDENLLEFEADEDGVPDLNPQAAPDPVGVYDRPEAMSGRGLSLAAIVGILILVIIAVFVLMALL